MPLFATEVEENKFYVQQALWAVKVSDFAIIINQTIHSIRSVLEPIVGFYEMNENVNSKFSLMI